MSLFSYFRISKPSAEKVPADQVDEEYKRLRTRTFWGVTTAYIFYYVCRMTLGVVKQPVIDGGVLSAGELGVIGSIFYFVYAAGKFSNGFIADYCNIRRFMAWGLGISAVINVTLGILGLLHGPLGIGSLVMLLCFAILWGVNGWVQSMGSPPGTISLSRWFPLNKRGTMYSIFSSTPSFGKAGEPLKTLDKKPTKELQKWVFRHPGIWVIAISSAFIYITQHAVSDWGVLFLQKQKTFSLESATQIIGISEAFGVVGNLLAGWISDRLFHGNRARPVVIAGALTVVTLALFLFTGGTYWMNILYIALFSMAFSVVFCIVAGLMALDFVPRKATGAALGIVGISSYAAAGAQSIVSGFLIEGHAADGVYDFGPVSIFWIIACLIAFILPVVGWKYLRNKED